MVERNVTALAFFVILAASSSAAALGLAPLPGSLQPGGGFSRFAAGVLFFGSVAVIVGVLWSDRLDGLAVEQFGALLAGFGTLFYAVALGLQSDGDFYRVAFAMGNTLCVTVFCGLRWWQIEKYVSRRRKAHKHDGD